VNRDKLVAVGKAADFVWCHQCFKGARNEAGGRLDGFSASRFMRCFPRAKGMLAGDIHSPQPVGDAGQYVGAPYPVDHGDAYEPRCVRMEGTAVVSMPRVTLKKASLFSAASAKPARLLADYSKGDRVKVTLELARGEMYRWDEIKDAYGRYCKKQGIELVSLQPKVDRNAKSDARTEGARSMANPVLVLAAYCRTRKDVTPRSLKFGFRLLKIARKRKARR
jgi:hypothetical protein